MTNTARRPQALLFGAVAGAIAVALVVALIAVVRSGATGAPVPGGESLPSATGLFVDPMSSAALQAQEWQAQGRTEDARRMGAIAAQPVPLWATAPTGQVGPQVSAYVARAKAAEQRPYLVAYHVPNRDCQSFSAGGAESTKDYATWVRELAGAIEGTGALVVVEPDAVPHEVSGCAGAKAEARYGLLTDAVEVLKGAGATVYLDAGNPGFVTDIGAIAGALERSGVAQADGFSLNVANFFPTADTIAYGRQISDVLGGTHFVIDTSRNGNGRPATTGEIDGGPAWCNPPGRAIGQAPTLSTGQERVDAFLWVKRPGESDGSCRPDEKAAGQWMPDYALGLVPKA
ncbi:MAG: glycoside hydrolase family 6 protein [Pseudonocardia sp.]|nr:glycoside hydrolase family 6 protein [Pseudonocardia sp.]